MTIELPLCFIASPRALIGAAKALYTEVADKIGFFWDAPATKDDNEQIEMINNAVAAGVNFIYVDSPAKWDGAQQTIAAGNEAAGNTMGEELPAALLKQALQRAASAQDMILSPRRPELVNEGVLLCVMAQDPCQMGFKGINPAYEFPRKLNCAVC